MLLFRILSWLFAGTILLLWSMMVLSCFVVLILVHLISVSVVMLDFVGTVSADDGVDFMF